MESQNFETIHNDGADTRWMTPEEGRERRRRRPRSSLAELADDPNRDPIAITSADDADRLADLLPERYLRMSASPFTWYRGSAAVMAHDLGALPDSGIITQLCGDAHISNFGVFASPERELLFDVNDFDETSPGPFEWDVQRLAASVVLAARDLGVDAATQRGIAKGATEGYRRSITALAAQGELDVWYRHVPVDELIVAIKSRSMRKTTEATLAKARSRDAASAARKLTESVDGKLRFKEDPPLLVRLPGIDHELMEQSLRSYLETLQPSRRRLLERFRVIDVARKAVGVGSVGTRCGIALLEGRLHGEPLILQLKEAGPSVLEQYTAPDPTGHHGMRVVLGQRLMQAASDIFLGWTTAPDGHHYYWRQLRDMKFSPDLSTMRPAGLALYAQMCGQVLARAHARSGNRAAIAAYIGGGEQFPTAVTAFAEAYADRAESDFALMVEARADGRLP